MNLVRWNDPFSGLTSLHSQLDDMFNGLLSSTPSATAPAIDIYTEDNKNLVAEVQVPGFDKDDVEVNVNNNVLEIKGERSEKSEEKDKKRSYMLRESHTSFYRSIALPKHADADHVTAGFENGVLKVIVPFKELPQPKRIAIAAGHTKKDKPAK